MQNLLKILTILIFLFYILFLYKGNASATGWRQTSPTFDYFSYPILISKSNFIYAFTGHNAYYQWYEYATTNQDGTLSQWSSIYYGGALALSKAAGAIGNGNIFYGGGRGQAFNIVNNDIAAIPILSNGLFGNYTVQPSMNERREAHTCIYSNGFLYMIAGNTAAYTPFEVSGPSSTVEFAKETSIGRLGNWQFTNPLSLDSGVMMGGWVSNGYLYVLSSTGNVERALQNLDGTLGVWQKVGQVVPISGPPVLTENTTLFVIGNGGSVYRTGFSPTAGLTGNWIPDQSTMICHPYGHNAISIGRFIYVVGGCGSEVEFSSDNLTEAPLYPDE